MAGTIGGACCRGDVLGYAVYYSDGGMMKPFIIHDYAELFVDGDFGPSLMINGKPLASLLAQEWGLEYESPPDIVGDRAAIGKVHIRIERVH